MTLSYSSVSGLVDVLGFRKSIPAYGPDGSDLEEVGQGDNSVTLFYLDQRNIVPSSYVISYGASGSSVTALTETTHYAIDTDTGVITLTPAGVTAVGTDKTYASYSYLSLELKPSYLTTVLERAEAQVDNTLNTTFTAAGTNPSTPASTSENHSTQGFYNKDYFTDERPLINVVTDLDGDITAADTTISITDAGSLPSSGRILVGSEIISYAAVSTNDLTGCSRGVAGSTAAVHSDEDSVISTIIQISSTGQGSSPTWNTLQWISEFFVLDSGKLQIYDYEALTGLPVDNGMYPYQGVDNRIRITYLYGYNSVPADITRLTYIYAKEALVTDNISGNYVEGKNSFNPNLVHVNRDEMSKIENAYRILKIGNT